MFHRKALIHNKNPGHGVLRFAVRCFTYLHLIKHHRRRGQLTFKAQLQSNKVSTVLRVRASCKVDNKKTRSKEGDQNICAFGHCTNQGSSLLKLTRMEGGRSKHMPPPPSGHCSNSPHFAEQKLVGQSLYTISWCFTQTMSSIL